MTKIQSHSSAHPFFCQSKRTRKTAWETPEYLSSQDWALATKASKANSPEEFHAVVFESPETSEAFFYRVVGWPEGRSYTGYMPYLQNIWPSFSANTLRLLEAACDGLLKTDGTYDIGGLNQSGHVWLKFQREINAETFEAACSAAIDLAKRICPQQIACAITFIASGIGIQVVESDCPKIQHALFLRRLAA